MQNIFYGMLLIFIDVSFNVGSAKIGLIPDFLGYMLMIKGINEISSESDKFIKAKLYMKLMVVYTLCWYIGDLLGISNHINELLSIVLGIIAMIVSLYIRYSIIAGIVDIEKKCKYNLNTQTLYSVWKAYAIFSILACVALLIPIVGFIIVIISAVINIYFLVAFDNSKNLYYEFKIHNLRL